LLVIPAESDLLTLTVAAGHAAATELADPFYRSALATWVDRPASSGDGVPAATAAAPAVRPVPLRDFLAHDAQTSVTPDPPPVGDRHASYAVVATAGDRPADWLTAGEALSALLLTATAHGLSTSPMTDLVEVPASRSLLRELLADDYPALVVRIGVPVSEPPATTFAPRRPGSDVVHVAVRTDHHGSRRERR
jgi:nitroreductase